MKWLIASDIHGSSFYCQKLIDAIEKEKADKVLLLGDVLYHGPRNDLPKEYAPKKVIEMLNGIKNKVLCVRGNCDTEVDQMVLDFPVLADYAIISVGKKIIYATHGHKYGPDNMPPLQKGDVLLFGHIHIPKCEEKDGFVILNPGSVSIPKEKSENSYMIINNNEVYWKNLEGETYNKCLL